MSRMSSKNNEHNQSIINDSSNRKIVQSLKIEGPTTNRSQAFPIQDRDLSHHSTGSNRESQSYVNAMKALQDKITKLESENNYFKVCLTDTLAEIKELKQIIDDVRNREYGFILKLEQQELIQQDHDKQITRIKQLEQIIHEIESKKVTKHKENTLSVDEFTLDQLLREFQTSQTNFKQISNTMIYKYGSSPNNHKKIDLRPKMTNKKIESQDSFTEKKKPHVYDMVRVPSFSQIEAQDNQAFTSFSSDNSIIDNMVVLQEQQKLLDELTYQQKSIQQKIKNLQNLQNNALAGEMRSNLNEQLALIVQQRDIQQTKIQQVRSKLQQ